METDVIYLGDCRDILPRIPAESVDCVVTDVAYRVNCAGRGTMSGAFVESARRGAVFSENDVAIEDYIGELYRILKPETHCYIFCNNLNLPHFLDAITRRSGFRFIKSLIWDKCRKISGRYYMGCFEYILFLRKGGDRQINDCSTPDILRYPTPRKLEYSGGWDCEHDAEARRAYRGTCKEFHQRRRNSLGCVYGKRYDGRRLCASWPAFHRVRNRRAAG